MIWRSRRFVQRWCYAYRDHGLDGLKHKAHSGRPHRLATTQHHTFKQRILDGPTNMTLLFLPPYSPQLMPMERAN